MLKNIRVVLVRPRGSGNIGSVARAMKNTGLSELAIVGKARTRSFWARAMAVHGREILSQARCVDTLRQAVGSSSARRVALDCIAGTVNPLGNSLPKSLPLHARGRLLSFSGPKITDSATKTLNPASCCSQSRLTPITLRST